MKWLQKKSTEDLRTGKFLNRASNFDRRMLHIVQGKGGKDRYVTLSEHLIQGLKTFISIENPERCVFNGNQNRNIEEIDASTSLRTGASRSPSKDLIRATGSAVCNGSLKPSVKRQGF